MHTYIHTFIDTSVQGYTDTYIHTDMPTYIALHYITLHYIALQRITLHCMTWHYIALQCWFALTNHSRSNIASPVNIPKYIVVAWRKRKGHSFHSNELHVVLNVLDALDNDIMTSIMSNLGWFENLFIFNVVGLYVVVVCTYSEHMQSFNL